MDIDDLTVLHQLLGNRELTVSTPIDTESDSEVSSELNRLREQGFIAMLVDVGFSQEIRITGRLSTEGQK